MPLSIKIISILTVLNELWVLIDIVTGKYVLIPYLPLPMHMLIILEVVKHALNLAFLYAVIKRFRWGWKLFLLLNSISIVLLILVSITNQAMLVSFRQNPLQTLGWDLLSLGIDLIMIYFIYRNRRYFNQ